MNFIQNNNNNERVFVFDCPELILRSRTSIKYFEHMLRERSECFTKYFPEQSKDFLKYFISNNKLLFYFEIKFESNFFTEKDLVNNNGLVTKVGYDYSMYETQYEDTIVRHILFQKYDILENFLDHLFINFRGLVSFIHADFSFVESTNTNAINNSTKCVKLILAFETFANEPTFFINGLLSFKINGLAFESKATHLTSLNSLDNYWTNCVELAKFNTIPFAYSFFYHNPIERHNYLSFNSIKHVFRRSDEYSNSRRLICDLLEMRSKNFIEKRYERRNVFFA